MSPTTFLVTTPASGSKLKQISTSGGSGGGRGRDPADYPADRGDDDDNAEDEHLAPAEPAAVTYSADQDPYIA
ncbi:hypothetical protein Tco_0240389, partial [Tanacetum coccineum]